MAAHHRQCRRSFVSAAAVGGDAAQIHGPQPAPGALVGAAPRRSFPALYRVRSGRRAPFAVGLAAFSAGVAFLGGARWPLSF